MRKKSWLGFLSVITIFAGISSPISSASATLLTTQGEKTYTVGESVFLDASCDSALQTDQNFVTGTLPPGLSMDGQGLITGIPSAVGDYTISDLVCTIGYFTTEYVWWSLTFHITAVPTPAPTLTVHSLNTESCSFYVGFLFPVTPDAGSVYIDIDNGSGNSIHAFSEPTDQRSSGTLYGGTISIEDLNLSTDIFGLILGTTGYRAYTCGDTFTISVGYQSDGAPVGSASATGVVVDKPIPSVSAGGYPTLTLIPLSNANCEFRVLGYLPSLPKSGSTKLTISSAGGSVAYTIADETAKGVLDFTFSPQSVFNGSLQTGMVSRDYQITSGQLVCGVQLYVDLEYVDLQQNFWALHNGPGAAGSFITTSNGQDSNNNNNGNSGDYTVSAARSYSGNCSISVVATVPAPGPDPEPLDFPMSIVITSVEDPNPLSPYAYAAFVQVPEDGVITATLSLANVNDMIANVPLIYGGIPSDETCAGFYRVALVFGPGAVLATSIFNLTPSTCNAGYFLSQDPPGCYQVGRGYYTTELNSTIPLACPAGMTTATPASKSLNDCYKPLVQSIVGLKAPKALKFKATTNLAITTNTKAQAWFRVVGPCSAKLANVVTKVKGKKVTTKMLRVTAGTKAGICLIDLTAPTSGKYLNLKKVVQIKVSKTGK